MLKELAPVGLAVQSDRKCARELRLRSNLEWEMRHVSGHQGLAPGPIGADGTCAMQSPTSSELHLKDNTGPTGDDCRTAAAAQTY